jgi:hypothetical protein
MHEILKPLKGHINNNNFLMVSARLNVLLFKDLVYPPCISERKKGFISWVVDCEE